MITVSSLYFLCSFCCCCNIFKKNPFLQTPSPDAFAGFVQKNISNFTNFLQIFSQLQNPGMMPKYGTEKQHKGTQIFRTSGKGAQPLL